MFGKIPFCWFDTFGRHRNKRRFLQNILVSVSFLVCVRGNYCLPENFAVNIKESPKNGYWLVCALETHFQKENAYDYKLRTEACFGDRAKLWWKVPLARSKLRCEARRRWMKNSDENDFQGDQKTFKKEIKGIMQEFCTGSILVVVTSTLPGRGTDIRHVFLVASYTLRPSRRNSFH